VEAAFDRLFEPLRAHALEAIIAAELGSVEVLDDFVARPGGRVRALPIGRACIVSSRTTIGVALLPALFALCAGCEVLVKDREDHLIAAFFETLSGLSPELSARAAAQAWSGDSDAVDLSAFDAVVAFGSDATLEDIAQRLPFRTRFIPYAAKASAGYVAAAALQRHDAARAVAEGAALDALLYDGEGCMSLHVLFVESGGDVSPGAFAALLRDAFTETARIYPAAPSPATSARVALRRDDAALSAHATVISDDRASYLLVCGSADGEPPLLLPRAMNLVTVNNLSQAAKYLERHAVSLEALAVAAEGRDYVEFATAFGASRITTFGAMQAPPPGSPHGGRPRIAEFVRWIADET
jgi:acyl-CoA reductase-like NAD-dependent aldehyde dehydrogenase